jgi:hypothetical protein
LKREGILSKAAISRSFKEEVLESLSLKLCMTLFNVFGLIIEFVKKGFPEKFLISTLGGRSGL